MTLLLSLGLIGLTAGLSLLWPLGRVYRMARRTPCDAPPCDLIVALGRRLRHDAVGKEYAERLRRAHALQQGRPRAEILLVGGKTGGARVSEAEQGRRFLLARGVPADRIRLEDRSRHTLENFRHVRALLGRRGRAPFVLITSRAHLARSSALARGLGLRPLPCAAEDALRLHPVAVARLLSEAFYLHWYVVGRAWSQWTANWKSLERIT